MKKSIDQIKEPLREVKPITPEKRAELIRRLENVAGRQYADMYTLNQEWETIYKRDPLEYEETAKKKQHAENVYDQGDDDEFLDKDDPDDSISDILTDTDKLQSKPRKARRRGADSLPCQFSQIKRLKNENRETDYLVYDVYSYDDRELQEYVFTYVLVGLKSYILNQVYKWAGGGSGNGLDIYTLQDMVNTISGYIHHALPQYNPDNDKNAKLMTFLSKVILKARTEYLINDKGIESSQHYYEISKPIKDAIRHLEEKGFHNPTEIQISAYCRRNNPKKDAKNKKIDYSPRLVKQYLAQKINMVPLSDNEGTLTDDKNNPEEELLKNERARALKEAIDRVLLTFSQDERIVANLWIAGVETNNKNIEDEIADQLKDYGINMSRARIKDIVAHFRVRMANTIQVMRRQEAREEREFTEGVIALNRAERPEKLIEDIEMCDDISALFD